MLTTFYGLVCPYYVLVSCFREVPEGGGIQGFLIHKNGQVKIQCLLQEEAVNTKKKEGQHGLVQCKHQGCFVGEQLL